MTASDESKFPPDTLPAEPAGFTRRLVAHMSFEDGAAGHYAVYDPQRRALPISWQYDTRPLGASGFAIKGRDGLLTWAELVAYWPEFIAAQAVPA